MTAEFNALLDHLVKWLPSLVTALAVFVIGYWLSRLIAGLVESSLSRRKKNVTLILFIKNLVYYALLTFVVITALESLGIHTTTFIAILGAAGLAIALALQNFLANLAAGVMIVALQPFEVGDKVEAGGAAGTVKEIQIFTTIVVTSDNKRKIVPNSKIIGDVITVEGKA